MNKRREGALRLLVAVLITSTATTAGAQPPTSPPPPGNRIVAQDGDVVVVENDARVRIVHRREASVRVVFDAAERWLLLLADLVAPGSPADGRVDHIYYYLDVEGTWPYATPWEGVATIEEYSTVALGTIGLGIATPDGLVQLRQPSREWEDPNAAAVLTHRRGGRSSSIGDLTFDAAARWYTAELRRNDGVMRSPSDVTTSGSLSLKAGTRGGGDPDVPARVGGNIQPPVKTLHVPPVTPDMAVRANVRGIVILEVTVDVDGTVKDARVLRSIPLLDAAALEAVRQWRYEPSTVDGKPMPVIMTVSVAF